jgi:hypothetical protein
MSPMARSAVWAVVGIVVLAAALYAAIRLLMRPAKGSDPTVAGALVLVGKDGVLEDIPLYTYAGDVRRRSAVIGVSLAAGPEDTPVRILFSHVRSNDGISTSADVSVVKPPRRIGTDSAQYSFHQSHRRDIVAIDVLVAAGSRVSISCNVTCPPDMETCTTCRMAFAPPLNRDLIAIASQDGYQPVLPVMANVQRIAEATGFFTSGGRRVHDHMLGSITESAYLDARDPILRAFWTDESKRSWQSFWLFFLAAASALGVALIFEALRPLIDTR